MPATTLVARQSRRLTKCAKTKAEGRFRVVVRFYIIESSRTTFHDHSTDISMETLSPTTHERRICQYLGSACSHLPCIPPRSFLYLSHT